MLLYHFVPTFARRRSLTAPLIRNLPSVPHPSTDHLRIFTHFLLAYVFLRNTMYLEIRKGDTKDANVINGDD